MRDEEGQIVTVDLPSISALWPTRKKWPDEIKHIPSVLGSDFLTITKFALYFNPSKEIAFLEKQATSKKTDPEAKLPTASEASKD